MTMQPRAPPLLPRVIVFDTDQQAVVTHQPGHTMRTWPAADSLSEFTDVFFVFLIGADGWKKKHSALCRTAYCPLAREPLTLTCIFCTRVVILHFSVTYPTIGRQELFLTLCWFLPLNLDSFTVYTIRCIKKKILRILSLDLIACLTV